jgi:hypothetical protein
MFGLVTSVSESDAERDAERAARYSVYSR